MYFAHEDVHGVPPHDGLTETASIELPIKQFHINKNIYFKTRIPINTLYARALVKTPSLRDTLEYLTNGNVMTRA